MARMSHLFELRTGYGNRTHIARLRILSTNRYTNPACIFPSRKPEFSSVVFVWDCKGRYFFFNSKLFGKNFSIFFVILFQEYEEYRQQEAEKSCQVVPLQRLSLEEQSHYQCEYGE